MTLSTSQVFRFDVSDDLCNMRIDQAATSALPMSRSQIQLLISQGRVLINDQIANKPSIKVALGDNVKIISYKSAAPSRNNTTRMNPLIIYEDTHLMVIDKPAGLAVYPANEKSDSYTLVDFLKSHCGSNLSNASGEFRAGIVHRLDKDTSGLMIVAKNNIAHLNLSNQIKTRTLKRIYQALIWGVPYKTIGDIESYIARDKINRLKMKVSKNNGKFAKTSYKVLTIFAKGAASLVQCELDTGRTHQIRAHMSYIGHSIIGDQMYGKNNRKALNHFKSDTENPLFKLKRQALYSCKITFVHPDNNKTMSFSGVMPPEIQIMIDYLESKSLTL